MLNKRHLLFAFAGFVLVAIFFVFSNKTKDYQDPLGNEYSLSELKNCFKSSVDDVFICPKDFNS